MANTIQVKRGIHSSLPTLGAGEFGFSTDTKQVHIGDGAANHELVMHSLFDANTFLYATGDNTPAVKTRAEVMALLSGQSDADFAMNTHKITGVVDPTLAQDVATKAYADSVASGLTDNKNSCRVATTEALPACTASGLGVGKTLTANANGVLTVDGVGTVINDRVLVQDQATGSDNGIYSVTTEGTAGVTFVLTRATDCDTDSDVSAGLFTFVEEGTTNGDYGFVLSTNNPITVDTTNLTFTIFSSAGAGVPKTLFDANSILKADSDNTPTVLSVGVSTFIGRKASGNIAAMSVSDALTLLGVESGADVTDATNVNSAGAVMESDFNANTFLYATTDDTPEVKTRAEVMALLSGQAGAEFLMNTQKIGGVVDPTTAQQVSTKNYSDTRTIDGGAFA